MNPIFFTLIIFFLCSCNSSQDHEEVDFQNLKEEAEFIYRKKGQFFFKNYTYEKAPPPVYYWESGLSPKHPPITKEFFRCKGSGLNPIHLVAENGKETLRYSDCNGPDKHSLPLKNQKEFIYPVLIDILNWIQLNTGKRLIITSGHRCPEHNSYVDPSPKNHCSKHMIGAEVSFYVQGMENDAEKIVQKILDFYKNQPRYRGQKEYEIFYRYDKETDTAIQPWFNKEIFVKLYTKNEGRNFDNRHPYPYISIQVRYDRDLQERVSYSWPQAQNYLRH
jgi:hypothetical protein